MKTTIDLPDDILRRAKVTAIQRNITLKELVIQGLELASRQSGHDREKQRQARATKLIAALAKGRNTKTIGRFNREEIYDR
ncbi:MAG: hypothetical protein QM796_19625 [Chthoniobacteraceae bacterium]